MFPSCYVPHTLYIDPKLAHAVGGTDRARKIAEPHLFFLSLLGDLGDLTESEEATSRAGFEDPGASVFGRYHHEALGHILLVTEPNGIETTAYLEDEHTPSPEEL